MRQRYGNPIVVCSLIKQKENTPREMKLHVALSDCMSYFSTLPSQTYNFELQYFPWDMRRASKAKWTAVYEYLSNLARNAMTDVGYFHAGPKQLSLQHGVLRTNCVDNLDRTNTAQSIAGLVALAYQLRAMHLSETDELPFGCPLVKALVELYEGMGDAIARQYAGSSLVNTVATYVRATSSSKVTAIRRFYSNTCTYYVCTI